MPLLTLAIRASRLHPDSNYFTLQTSTSPAQRFPVKFLGFGKFVDFKILILL